LARQAGADYVVGYDEFGATVGRVTQDRGRRRRLRRRRQGHLRRGGWRRCGPARGMMVLFGGSSGQVPAAGPAAAEQRRLALPDPPHTGRFTPRTGDELLWRATDVLGAVAAGQLNVRVGTEYSLAHAPAGATRDLAARRTTGKLLLIP